MPFYLVSFGRAYLREFGLFYLLAIYAILETKGLFWERDFLRWAFGTWPAAAVAWGLLAFGWVQNLLFLGRQIRSFPALRNLISSRRGFWELNEFFHLLCTPVYGYGALVVTRASSPFPALIFAATSLGLAGMVALFIRHRLHRAEPAGRPLRFALPSPGLWRLQTLLTMKPGPVVAVKVLSLSALVGGSYLLQLFGYGALSYSVFFILIGIIHLGLFTQVQDLEGEHFSFLWGYPVGTLRSLFENWIFILALFLPEALTLLWFGIARAPMPGLALKLIFTAVTLYQGARILPGLGIRNGSTLFPLLMLGTVIVMAFMLAGFPPWLMALLSTAFLGIIIRVRVSATARHGQPWVW